MYVNDAAKRTEIWLTCSEQSDDEVTELVDEICRNNLHSGYRTVVFVSGTHSLLDCTEGLLCQNLGM